MVVLAIVLILIAIVATVAVVAAGTTSITLEAFDYSLDTNTIALFVAGLAAGALFLLGLGLLNAAMRRGRQRRQELRALRDRQTDAERERERLAREKEELSERLERRSDDSAPAARRGRPSPQS